MKSESETFHDSIVRQLENLLTEQGFNCQTFVEYKEGKREGEIDLFAIDDTLPPRYQFYEVKGHLRKSTLRHAKQQYQRYLQAYNLSRRDVQGFFYSSEGKRIAL